MPKINLFRKIVILLTIMLIPILLLYYYNNKVTTDLLKTELNKVNYNQLVFLQSQINAQINSISQWPQLLIGDPDISGIANTIYPQADLNLETINLMKDVQIKLRIQENSTNWKTSISLYSPVLERLISQTNVSKVPYDKNSTNNLKAYSWEVSYADEQPSLFSLQVQYPQIEISQKTLPNLIITVQFNSDNIVTMLDKFKSDGRSDPFFYKHAEQPITNSSSDKVIIDQIINQLSLVDSKQMNHQIDVDGEIYWVGVVPSTLTGWSLIDYVPVSEIMQPVNRNNILFYIVVTGLILMSLSVAYLLYSQVQVPILELIKSFNKIKISNYKVRIVDKGNNEFSYLYSRFNAMAEQIQDLFERVYLEQLYVKEARLKQLQSQINPHFFYNCFNYITSMAKLDNTKAVVAMAENLASYYRYTTRQERDVVYLKDEIEFVTLYLEIQNMRLNRLQYSINIPSYLYKYDVPLLIIQPIVENAVLHGIEQKADGGRIEVSARIEDEMLVILIDDNGKGMTFEQRSKAQYSLNFPLDESMGCGLWNVQQRIKLKYGDKAGIQLLESPLGGLQVKLFWDYLD